MATRGRRSRSGRRFGALLLDLDGCLIDSNDAHARAWRRALAGFGHRVAFRRLRVEIGKGGSELLRGFLRPAEHHFLADAMGAVQTRLYLERFGREVRPFNGAAAAVRAMRRAGIRVVIASSADRTALERALALLRISDAIAGFTCADDVPKSKPFPDVFSLAISRFHLAGRRPLAVGDTPYDVAAAHQLGLPCVGLLSGGFSRRSLASADGRFDGLADLWRRGREWFA